MSFTQAISSCFRQYVGFSGRAMRSEFWYFQLFAVLLTIGASIVDPTGVIGGLISLVLFLPSLAVSVRRLHDTDRSGWWLLIALIPLIGIIVLIVWWATTGTAGPNKHGLPPRAEASAADADDNTPAAAEATGRTECPRCGESIPRSARVCRFCNYELRP